MRNNEDLVKFTDPHTGIKYFLDLLRCYPDIEKDVPAFILSNLRSDNPDFTSEDMAEAVLYGAHQLRLPKIKKEAIVKIFTKEKPWNRKYKDFESLYSEIKSLIGSLGGELTIYDVALRIGRVIGIEPEIFVYEASGKVKKTAKEVLNPGVKQLWRNKKIDFVSWLQLLTAHEIEVFLCVVNNLSKTSTGWEFNLPTKLCQKICYPSELREKLHQHGVI